jgi:hypothetical protein
MMENTPSLDHVGIVASCVCAAHCILTPLLIAVFPMLGLTSVVEAQAEWLFAGASFVIGGVSLVPAYAKRHRRCRPLLLFGCGFLLLLVARLWLEERLHLEMSVVIVAAALIVISHLANLRLCQACALCTGNSE